MLNVNYKISYGYALMLANDNKTYLKVDIHGANCLFATIYHYTKTNEETGKVEKWSQLVGFYSDLQHLKRCYNPKDPIYSPKQIKKVVLYNDFKEVGKVAEIIAKCGFIVEIRPNPKAKKTK